MNLASLSRAVPLAKAAAVAVVSCVLCGAAGLGVGAWLGVEWQEGRQAKAENVELTRSAEQLATQVDELRQRGLDVVQDFRTAQRRLEAIVEGNDRDRDAIDTLFAEQRAATETWLATRLDLYDCRIGPDGVQAWNASAVPGATASPTAEHLVVVAAPVPRDAAAADRGPRAGDGAQSPAVGAAVPHVPVRPRADDRGRDRL